MADKLDPVKLEQPSVPVSDDTIVDVMLQCDAKLIKMFNVVGELEEDVPAAEHAASPSRGSTRGSARTADVHPAAEGGAANYNVRVALEEIDDLAAVDDDDDEIEGLEPDVLGREDMKKMHGAMLDKATSKSKKKKKGKFGAADAKASPTASTSGKPSAGARGSLA